jgi:hypothetical protein
MSLSASFSEDLRNEFAKRNLKIGTVIRVFVNDTNPPKEKRLILVGQSYDTLYFATVFINSEINPNVFPTQELRDLNFPLTANNRDYLVHDSFADCSGLAKRPTDWLLKTLIANPEAVIGEISEADLTEIRTRIKSARTISTAVKKTFGLFL